ncbi:hypothetical protein LDENG_00058600 [Lucifuga dentata]|nr:hypothetical protein LDENG_00058600 [Lucifuga dentata]
MFSGSYVPRVLCFQGPMFSGSYVPRVLCFQGPMFPSSVQHKRAHNGLVIRLGFRLFC